MSNICIALKSVLSRSLMAALLALTASVAISPAYKDAIEKAGLKLR
jgi:hypothetical protein